MELFGPNCPSHIAICDWGGNSRIGTCQFLMRRVHASIFGGRDSKMPLEGVH